MAITNHERVGKALDLLRAGLQPFVGTPMPTSWICSLPVFVRNIARVG
jgi:hypothetical protein